MFAGVSEVSSCAVCGERDECWCTLMCGVWVGMRAGSVLLWARYGRMEVAEVSVTSARAWVEGCDVMFCVGSVLSGESRWCACQVVVIVVVAEVDVVVIVGSSR